MNTNSHSDDYIEEDDDVEIGSKKMKNLDSDNPLKSYVFFLHYIFHNKSSLFISDWIYTPFYI